MHNEGVKDIAVTGLILLLIAGVAGVALGFVNSVTEGPIAEQDKIAENESKIAAFPGAKKFEAVDDAEWKSVLEDDEKNVVTSVDTAENSEDVLGYVIGVAPQGYGGPIEMMVGISEDGKITGINIVNHSETPGLGAKSDDPKWQSQFNGKPADSPLELVKNKKAGPSEVEALTGATVTSTGVTKGINVAIDLYNKIK